MTQRERRPARLRCRGGGPICRAVRPLSFVLAVVAASVPALAGDLGSGRLPIRFTPPPTFAARGSDEIRIEGDVAGPGNVVLVVRIDDDRSGDYASRYNQERTLPPGPFRWSIGLQGLQTPNGRDLDLAALRRLHLFSAGSDGQVSIRTFAIVEGPRLPHGAAGYAFGHPRAPAPPGFKRVAPGDSMIEAGRALPIRRPAPDPLVANGLRAVERIRLPAPFGRVRLTLWLEDPGEWSDLAHPLQRDIRVNGQRFLQWRKTPAEWVASRYLRHRHREHDASDDAWSAYGRWRGDRTTLELDGGAGGLSIELFGGSAEELFVSAALVEPAEGSDAVARVEAWRADWYRSNWPIGAAAGEPAPPVFGASMAGRRLEGVAAPGSGLRLRFSVAPAQTVAAPRIVLVPPTRGGEQLGLRLWAAQRRLERRGAGDTILVLADDMLRGDPSALPLTAGRARTYEVWIDVPASTPPGVYEGRVSISGAIAAASAEVVSPNVASPVAASAEAAGAEIAVVPVRIEVLDVALPAAAKPAGYYLDEAPHLTWFESMRAERASQLACDLGLMRALGIAGSAPALSTPGTDPTAFVADMRRAREFATAAPWLAYAPAKRLREAAGIAGSAAALGRLTETLLEAGLPLPVWSVADEPSNPGHGDARLQEWVGAIRDHAPAARIAAHLNAQRDAASAALFDVVLVNDGFGLDRGRMHALSGRHEVWVYNTALPRLTAGLWLWSMPAARYLQWHARMPTADPFDPTDGREGDVQMIFPGPQACPRQADIHRQLLTMAEGIVDQRWLTWLDARTGNEAEALRRRIRAALPDSWQDVRRIRDTALQAMRESIIALARVTK